MSFQVVFVCTGNRFRSPLAAGLFRAETAGLPVVVSSAGTLDLGAVPAVPEALEQAARFGADLSSHRARWLLDENLSSVDLVVGFEHAHIAEAVMKANAPSGRAFTLLELIDLLDRQPDGEEPSGPIGQARAAIVRADTLRTSSGTPVGQLEIADPLGAPPEVSQRIAATVATLTRQLADSLFGARAAP